MASAYHTVSDEVSWTDWSNPEDAGRTSADGKSRLGAVAAFLIALAMLAGVVFLLPAGSY